jgi:hypothetical protein
MRRRWTLPDDRHAVTSISRTTTKGSELDALVRDRLSHLPQVARIVVVRADGDSDYVVTVRGDWLVKAPQVHAAIGPLWRHADVPFRYRTVREDWHDPDPTGATVLFAR